MAVKSGADDDLDKNIEAAREVLDDLTVLLAQHKLLKIAAKGLVSAPSKIKVVKECMADLSEASKKKAHPAVMAWATDIMSA